jgi:hypothetical protein
VFEHNPAKRNTSFFGAFPQAFLRLLPPAEHGGYIVNKALIRLDVSARRALLPLITLCVALACAPCTAATDRADLSVGMKTLPLLTNKIEGSVTVAIVFDPASPVSRDDANNIKAIFDGGLEVPGDLKLNGLLVPVNELDKMGGTRIAVLAEGLGPHYEAISAAASAGRILTMSTDLSCVQSNKCVLGMVSKPHVEIYYSKSAADAAKISFGQVFTMLVKQI